MFSLKELPEESYKSVRYISCSNVQDAFMKAEADTEAMKAFVEPELLAAPDYSQAIESVNTCVFGTTVLYGLNALFGMIG